MQVNSLTQFVFVTELFHTSTYTGERRKRPFVPKPSKRGIDKDAKRRKVDKNDDGHQGSKKFNKSDEKHPKKEGFKSGGDKKFGGKTKSNVDKSNDASTNKKKLTKKKSKGKKKSHRNKNK